MSYNDDKLTRGKRRGRQMLIGTRKNRRLGSNTPVRNAYFRKANKGLSLEVEHEPTLGRGNVSEIRARVAERLALLDFEDVLTNGFGIA